MSRPKKSLSANFTVPEHSAPSENPLAGSTRGAMARSGRGRPRDDEVSSEMADSVRSAHLSPNGFASSQRGSDRDTASLLAAKRAAISNTSSQFKSIKASLRVELEHQVYYPGSVVRGTVYVTVKKPTSFHALRLRITGKESMVIRMKEYGEEILTKQRMTFWKQLYTIEGATKSLQTAIGVRQKYRDQQLRNRIDPSRLPTGKSPSFIASEGTYAYPFEVQLPYGIPPSFDQDGDEEDYAAIFYYAKAYLDVPGGGDADVIDRAFFRVVSRIGIKQWKSQAKPIVKTETFAVEGCCGTTKGDIVVNVEVPRRLISIAEDKVIPFRVVVNNKQGKVPVNRVKVQLVHVLNVHAEGKEEERRVVLASEVLTKRIEAGGTDGIIGSMPVPDDPPPTMEGILFSSKHQLIVEVDVPYAYDPVGTFDITLVQRVETEEDCGEHPLGKRNYELAVGLHEFQYWCPDSRATELEPIGVTPAPGVAGLLGRNLLGEKSMESAEFADLPPVIDYAGAPKKRPLPRWKLVPPLEYQR